MDGLLIVYSLVRPTEVKTRLECLQWQKQFFSLNSLHEDRLISAYFKKQGSDEEPKRKPVKIAKRVKDYPQASTDKYDKREEAGKKMLRYNLNKKK